MISAHVGGLPIEEALAGAAPAGLAVLAAIRATIPQRRKGRRRWTIWSTGRTSR